MARRRVGVLVSGSGSNLQALLDAAAAPEAPFEIVLVLANRPDAYGLERARLAGIEARLIDHRSFAGRETFEAALDAALREAGVEIVCLAGFMRVLTAGFVEGWTGRMLNIHPSLLPSFRGLHTHARALAGSCAVAGCTVHLVTPDLDAGPVVVQGLVPVLPGDTPESLAARTIEVEHRAYPRALAMLAEDRVRLEEGRATLADERPGERLLLHPLLAGMA
ncbi:phosphoribosylglycinamide formyltransferase [Marinimicrococcus flavescens]|uniref:Phosphoribosylglycinamide formyltransferase n=1 Tax=Marinimicrococcus flavescens TaxID=3031815 RepID=A0AAP3XQV9_9PROT|nr:phosphoribosylglycinamide formyltransferase [Marinimicrococcus flavescens]